MRSVVVVLPASICAAIPILRVQFIGYCRLGAFTDFFCSITACILNPENENAPSCFGLRCASNYYCLPAEMGKGLIGLGHLMHIISLPNRVTLPPERFHDFRCQSFPRRN